MGIYLGAQLITGAQASRVLHVDALRGNDATGSRDSPFQSPRAAQDYASAGDLIVVYPGEYTGHNLGNKADIAWYWHAGSSCALTPGEGLLWYFDKSGSATVLGHGVFASLDPANPLSRPGGVVATSAASVYFQADKVIANEVGLDCAGNGEFDVGFVSSSTYDGIITRPSSSSHVQRFRVRDLMADSDAIATEGTAVPDVPVVVEISRVLSAEAFLNNGDAVAAPNILVRVGHVGSVEDTVIGFGASGTAVVVVDWWPYAAPSNLPASVTFIAHNL
jgi:hypothetical protein